MQIDCSKKALQIGPYSRAFGAVVQAAARAAALCTFRCDVCGAELFFENSVCVTCGSAVGYSREHGTDRPQRESPDLRKSQPLRVQLDSRSDIHLGLCFSCRLTRTRPADADTVGLAQHWIAQAAKRRLIFGIDELELPIKSSDGSGGLAFDLLSSTHGNIITGYQPDCMLRRKTCNLSILSPRLAASHGKTSQLGARLSEFTPGPRHVDDSKSAGGELAVHLSPIT
jgi:hypothetical protein